MPSTFDEISCPSSICISVSPAVQCSRNWRLRLACVAPCRFIAPSTLTGTVTLKRKLVSAVTLATWVHTQPIDSQGSNSFCAAGSGAAIISDNWPGLETFFFPGKEILIADSSARVVSYLKAISEAEARAMGRRAQERVLSEHTAETRALQFEAFVGTKQQLAVSI